MTVYALSTLYTHRICLPQGFHHESLSSVLAARVQAFVLSCLLRVEGQHTVKHSTHTHTHTHSQALCQQVLFDIRLWTFTSQYKGGNVPLRCFLHSSCMYSRVCKTHALDSDLLFKFKLGLVSDVPWFLKDMCYSLSGAFA